MEGARCRDLAAPAFVAACAVAVCAFDLVAVVLILSAALVLAAFPALSAAARPKEVILAGFGLEVARCSAMAASVFVAAVLRRCRKHKHHFPPQCWMLEE